MRFEKSSETAICHAYRKVTLIFITRAYEKGTKYYAIQGISTEEAIAIAIEVGGKYRKAIMDGMYGEK